MNRYRQRFNHHIIYQTFFYSHEKISKKAYCPHENAGKLIWGARSIGRNVNSRQPAPMLKCKILLPKFNTWKRVLLERKNHPHLPLGDTVSRFLTTFSCHYGHMSSALRRKADAIWA